MQFATPLPSWAIALVALAVVGLALMAYRHAAGLRPAQRGLLIFLRAAALSLVILCLLRPMVLVPPPDRQDGVVAVLVDGSRSMGLRDAEGLTRIERAARERLRAGATDRVPDTYQSTVDRYYRALAQEPR